MNDAGIGGSSFTRVDGKSNAHKRNSDTIRIVSIKHATARRQKPASSNRAGEAEASGGLEIASAAEAFGGTLTAPSCPTFTGVPHWAQ